MKSNKLPISAVSAATILGICLLACTPIITADWEKASDQRWTVPFGGGVGKLTSFGKQPVDFKLQAFSIIDQPEGGPEWSLQFAVKFLFPK